MTPSRQSFENALANLPARMPGGPTAERAHVRPPAVPAPWNRQPVARGRDPVLLDPAFAAHDALALSLRAARERIVLPLARAAAPFVDARGWNLFGFARLEDYARERLDRSGRWVRDLARLGRALTATPRLALALTGVDGGRPIGCVAALLIARALEAEGDGRDSGSMGSQGGDSVESWIGAARRLSVRALGGAVRRAASPAAPSGPAAPVDPAGPADPDVFHGARTERSPEPSEDRALVRIQVPAPLGAAFDEAVELHRSVEGREATVTSFIEALVAEAGPADAVESGPIGPAEWCSTGAGTWLHRPPDAAIEEALRASTDAWAALPDPGGPAQAAALSGDCLERFQALVGVAGSGDAEGLDRQLRSLLCLDAELEARLGGLLAEMGERGAWSRLRFAGVGHYAEERLGLSRSRAEAAAHLARSLRRLPRLRAARESGRLGAEAAALIARLLQDGPADRDAEAAWIERAASCTIKRMRDEARALGRYRVLGTDRDSRPGAGRGWRRPLDDAVWQRSLRREVGTARRRVVALGLVAAGADPDDFHAADVPSAAGIPSLAGIPSAAGHPNSARLAEPDTFLRLRLPEDLSREFLRAVDSRRRALGEEAGRTPWDSPWPGDADAPLLPSRIAARVAFVRGRRVPAWVGLLALLEEYVFTWDVDHAPPSGRDDRVFVRDGWRCMAPGCTSRRNLEDHHVFYRARGGSDDLANRICLCRFHHQRGEHGGLMSVRGTAPLGLTWRMGQDALGGTFRNERRRSP